MKQSLRVAEEGDKGQEREGLPRDLRILWGGGHRCIHYPDCDDSFISIYKYKNYQTVHYKYSQFIICHYTSKKAIHLIKEERLQ